MVHFSYLIIPLLASLLSFCSSIFCSRKLLKLSLLSLFVFASFRYNVGGDYPAYYYIFSNISQGTVPPLYYAEPLFLSLNYVVAYLNLPFNVVLSVTNGVLLYSLYKLFSRLHHQYWFFLVSFFALSFNGYWSHLIYTRQEIALGFVLLATLALYDGHIRKYILLVLVASLFHNPALLAISFVFLRRRLKLFTIILLLVLSFLSVSLIKFILINYDNHYSAYLALESGRYFSISLIIDLILLFLVVFLVRKDIPSLYYNLFVIGKMIAIVKVSFPIIFRIELYFLPFNMLGLYYLYKFMARRKMAKPAMVIMLMSLSYSTLSTVKNINSKSDKYYWSGYKNILFEKSDLDYFNDRREYDNYHLLK